MGLEYMGEYYRNYAQVNLNHIRNNLELVRATIKKRMQTDGCSEGKCVWTWYRAMCDCM